MGMLGIQITEKQLNEIIAEVDEDGTLRFWIKWFVLDRVLSWLGSGELEFAEFVTLASRFMVEEDAEAMQAELKEAFRLYDKEGK